MSRLHRRGSSDAEMSLLECTFRVCMLCMVIPDCVFCGVCLEQNCQYTFVVRRRETMVYEAEDGNTYSVQMNSTVNKLQIIANTFHLTNAAIGSFVSPDDVITTDGVRRNVIAINDQFPGPPIEVMEGAQVEVKVTNHLFTDGVSIHWHGMHMLNNVWMDGVAYVTQCPILPRQSFTYRFIAEPAGTHWYHSHLSNQRLDGLYGALIVHKHAPSLPYHVLTVQDWTHMDAETVQLTSPFGIDYQGSAVSFTNPRNRHSSHDRVELTETSYVSTIINGRGRPTNSSDHLPLAEFHVHPNQTYRFRVIHTGAEYAYEIKVDDHHLTIDASDGQLIRPVTVDSFLIYPRERIDVLIITDRDPGIYLIRAEIMRHGIGYYPEPDGIVLGGKALLKYTDAVRDETVGRRRICDEANACTVFNCPFRGYPADMNTTCITFNEVRALEESAAAELLAADTDVEEVFLNMGYHVGSSINGRRFVKPKAPLFDYDEKNIASCETSECGVFGCKCTPIISLPYNKTVQLVLSGYQTASQNGVAHHSMHIHGHSLAVMTMGFPEYNQTTGYWTYANKDIACDTDELCANPVWSEGIRPELNRDHPPLKDTIIVPASGYIVVRFRSVNPGYWFFHCHRESHTEEGMALIFNVANGKHPEVPEDFPRCRDFKWSLQEFEKYMKKSEHPMVTRMDPETTVTSTSKPLTVTSTRKPQMVASTSKPQTVASTSKPGDQDNGQLLTVPLAVYTGSLLGCVSLGGCLVALPLLCYIYCVGKQTDTQKA